jgi:carboxyl-terminal processing protease
MYYDYYHHTISADKKGAMFMNKFTIKNFIILGFCLLTSLCADEKKDEQTLNFDEVIYNWSRTFAEVFQLTNQKHYKICNADQCMIKSIDTFLNCIDPHSNLLDPKTYKNMMEATSGEFFGIGVVIDNTRNAKDKQLIIIDTIPDGPADKAGIKPFDKIVEIEGKALEGMSTDEATAMLKGERHTKVHVKVVRENQPEILSFDITRDVIKEQNSLCFHIEDQNIYYLALTMFSDSSARQLEQLLTKAHEKEYKGLILDLRNNSGGLLTSAIDIAGLFLSKGSLVVTTKDKTGKVTEEYRTTRNPITTNIPIFILINNYTASAAEILAGALKIHADSSAHENGNGKKKNHHHNPMVFLVGTKTFGKGSVQEVIPVSNNCAIKITTSLYFLPDDTSIQAVGITPDFEIERCLPPSEQQQWLAQHYGREQALTNHIKLSDKKDDESKEKKEKDSKNNLKTWTERAQQTLLLDNQFCQTITLMNLLAIGQKQCTLDLNTRQKGINFINSIFVAPKKLVLAEVKIATAKGENKTP